MIWPLLDTPPYQDIDSKRRQSDGAFGSVRLRLGLPEAIDLIKSQYASVGAAARQVLPEGLAVLDQAAKRGLDVGDLAAKMKGRLANAEAFRDAYAAYVRPTNGLTGIIASVTGTVVQREGSEAERSQAAT